MGNSIKWRQKFAKIFVYHLCQIFSVDWICYNSLSEFNSKFLLFAPHSKYCFSNPLCLFLQIKYLMILKYNCSIQLHSSLIINIQITCLHGLKNFENIKIKYVFQSKYSIFFISITISTQVATVPLSLIFFCK